MTTITMAIENLQDDFEANKEEIEMYFQRVWQLFLDIRDNSMEPHYVTSVIIEHEDYVKRARSEEQSDFHSYIDHWADAKREIDRFFEEFNSRRLDTLINAAADPALGQWPFYNVGPEYPDRDIRVHLMGPYYERFVRRYCPLKLWGILNRYQFFYFRKGDPEWYEDAEMTRPKQCYRRPFTFWGRLFVLYMNCDKLDKKVKEEMQHMINPMAWYPLPGPGRRVIYHSGPTNSGKTYAALLRFREATSAIYCAPLRLLALQTYLEVNEGGDQKPQCNLHTGEDLRIHDGVNKLSCTVELADVDREWDVAIVDEIQMIGDRTRGGAWTRALLRLNAREIHLCGDSSARGVVERICKLRGDGPLEVVEHQRKGKLVVERNAVPLFETDIRAGDCVVGFSQNDLLTIAMTIRHTHPQMECVVLYGGLPPEIKFERSKRFRDLASTTGVLVATDAVGLGLNLPIGRIIFYRTKKFDGFRYGPLTFSSVKQIAGRAGRGAATGYVAATNMDDLTHVQNGIDAPVQPLRMAAVDFDPHILQFVQRSWRNFISYQPDRFLRPFYRELFYRIIYSTSDEGCTSRSMFFFREIGQQVEVGNELFETPILIRLTVSDYWTLCLSPLKSYITEAVQSDYNIKKKKVEWGESDISEVLKEPQFNPMVAMMNSIKRWLMNMFVYTKPCLLMDPERPGEFIHTKDVDPFDIRANYHYDMLSIYRYLYVHFPLHRFLFEDYPRIKEIESRIDALIREQDEEKFRGR